jgi:hypothetical protein
MAASLGASISMAGGRDAAAQSAAVSSWGATAQMLLEEHLAGHLPQAFTRRTLQVISEALAAANPSPDAASDPASLETLRREIETAGRSLDAGDRNGLNAALQAIREASARLRQAERTAR